MDAWFIEKDGKQYRDDVLISESAYAEIAARVKAENPEVTDFEAFRDLVDTAVDREEAEIIRANLIRRRKARDACYECPIRTLCLEQRLEGRMEYGTWGGYYREELQEIERLRDERERRRSGVE